MRIRFIPMFLCIFSFYISFPTMPAFANSPSEESKKIDYSRPIDHQKLEEYDGPSTCMDCHDDVVEQVLQSTHYTWKPKLKNSGKYSKLQMTAPTINWLGVLNKEKHTHGGCGFCHIGGGSMPLDSAKITEEDKDKLDCLICHATRYDIKIRFPKKVDGQWILPQDRSLEAARSVGRTTQDTCLRCHFIGLCSYKRGADLKEDVHYQRKMSCTRCHRVDKHQFPGFGPTITKEVQKRVRCIDCHDITPHKNKDINAHVRLDCRTCHIVKAGGVVYKNAIKNGIYNENAGIYKAIEKTANKRPEYFWYDGSSQGPMPKGSIDDPGSKIQPFKKFTGVAPVDRKSGKFLWLKLGTFAKTGDVEKAIKAGAKASDRPYSGSWEAKEYDVYFQLSHGVTKKHALRCKNCHSQNGVLDFKALGYSQEKIKQLIKNK